LVLAEAMVLAEASCEEDRRGTGDGGFFVVRLK
jgi:hypothetical protein